MKHAAMTECGSTSLAGMPHRSPQYRLPRGAIKQYLGVAAADFRRRWGHD
jgi:hypothetical protein